NRSMIAMVKHCLMALHETKQKFPARLRKMALDASEETVLRFVRDEAAKARVPAVIEMCECLLENRPNMFREILQFNRAEGDSNARVLCDRVAALSVMQLKQLEDE